MELPLDLRIAIDQELSSYSHQDLMASAQALSDRYRIGKPSGGSSFLKDKVDSAAYGAFRMPATFGAVYGALQQCAKRLPDFQPRHLLDVGAGPGTASWAAVTHWPQLEQITLLERDQGMIALGKRLSAHSDSPALKGAKWHSLDLTGSWEIAPHDLVIASYSLGELDAKQLHPLLKRLWAITGQLLVIIEPGTPLGFKRILEMRETLLKQGAHTLAPCPHDQPCPKADRDWCHFSQRIPRSRLHRQVKGAQLAHEDEKFSFIAVVKEPGLAAPNRITRHPLIRKGLIQMELCTHQGIQQVTVTKKDREAFRAARDASWGDSFPQKRED